MKKVLLSILISFLFAMLVLLLGGQGFAHPGRLNSEGCHNVNKDWEYKSGRVVKAGTYHCHRALGRMRLDGREALRDPNDPGKEKAETKKPESWFEWLKWGTF